MSIDASIAALLKEHDKVVSEYNDLQNKLHKGCQHPDFEYAVTELPRKSGVEPYPPRGRGWIVNVEKGRDGWERFDHTEETYWRRLKSEAAKDAPLPYELPPVTMSPLRHTELVTLLAGRLNSAYMPKHPDLTIDKIRPEFNSKPYYLKLREIQNLTRGSGRYQWTNDTVDSIQEAWLLKEERFKVFVAGNQPTYLFAGLAFPRLHIIVALRNTDDFFPAIVRCANEAGYWSEWVEFSKEHDFPLHLDRVALTEHLDTYF